MTKGAAMDEDFKTLRAKLEQGDWTPGEQWVVEGEASAALDRIETEAAAMRERAEKAEAERAEARAELQRQQRLRTSEAGKYLGDVSALRAEVERLRAKNDAHREALAACRDSLFAHDGDDGAEIEQDPDCFCARCLAVRALGDK